MTDSGNSVIPTRIIETTLEPIRRFIEAIDREYPVRFAYLFGSRARGEATADSDADIAVCLAKRYEKSEMAFNIIPTFIITR